MGEKKSKVFIPKTRFYVCVAPNYWGVGLSIEGAKFECKRAGGKLNGKYIVWKTPPGATDAYCDDIDGTVMWKWLDGADHTNKCEVAEYRGVKLPDNVSVVER